MSTLTIGSDVPTTLDAAAALKIASKASKRRWALVRSSRVGIICSPHWAIRPPSISGTAKPRPVTNSIRPTCSPPRSPDTSAVSYSTPQGSSSTWDAAHGCSPAPPATPCYSAIDGVSGPDAVSAPGAAKPTTPNHGHSTGRQVRPTQPPSAGDTTAGNNAATEPGATPKDTGTPTDPTAPRSANSPQSESGDGFAATTRPFQRMPGLARRRPACGLRRAG